MKLTKFRVQNFRSINDSGFITTDELTAILGRNESGKSNILLALQHLNPPGGMQDITAIKNFPRHRRLSEQKTYTPFLNTYWQLTEAEKLHLTELFPRAEEVSEVTVSRYYKAGHHISLRNLKQNELDIKKVNRLIDKMVGILESQKNEENTTVIEQKISEIEMLSANTNMDISDWLKAVENHLTILRSAIALAGEREDDFYDLKDDFATEVLLLDDDDKHKAALKYIVGLLPVFVYIDEYPHLNGHQNLSTVIANKQNGQLTEEDIGFLKLCTVADIDPEELQNLSSDPETRNQLVNRASAIVTKEIRRLWSDRELKIRFNIDGCFFDTYISDPTSTYDVEVNLDERSRGFKWFFSFYITFFADTHGGTAENAIILLDEPGLYLHAKSQSDLLIHLDKDFDNQIIYTTHSPFLVPTKRLSSVKTVNICQEKGTVVTNDPTGDATTLFPLQAALGYEVSQSLFIGSDNLVVEGITDFWYLSTMSEYLNSIGRMGLKKNITITPAGGAQKIPYLVSLLCSQHLNLLVLLDHEKEAIETKSELIAEYNMAKKNVILVSEAINGETPSEFDIEDLMGAKYFLELAEKAYSDELIDHTLIYNENIPRVSKRFEQAMKSAVGSKKRFVKAKPARLFMNNMARGDLDNMPEDLLDNFEGLFRLINKRMN
ncbi:AAA family ATPase [Vibrio parahaemolyticus]|uniref:AAA family ATPase n=1 Tax=Vibrio parahaemolyticus TaxID=670 RepID=UPI0005F2133A|nr:AAA family ATPase [Vibrio parahaemolyticus]MBM5066168.1 AAA family ATPase [Vibrio parahaemolyticus]MDG2647193.1 AAA family ATPase [Vibrio parahaemolyticus]MDG3391361.1 AAA family ATPase [Vibrio parahaemolyticus]MDG3401643.1 AAA family ATPase [Vibrio parahaemolyticus]